MLRVCIADGGTTIEALHARVSPARVTIGVLYVRCFNDFALHFGILFQPKIAEKAKEKRKLVLSPVSVS